MLIFLTNQDTLLLQRTLLVQPLSTTTTTTSTHLRQPAINTMSTMDTVTNISRDELMKQISLQAANVRRTFETHHSTRKHAVSSATAAAAQHMASLNRKRKFENSCVMRANDPTLASVTMDQHQDTAQELEWNKGTSQTFHSPIARFTRPEKARVVSEGSQLGSFKPAPVTSAAPTSVASVTKQQAPRVFDGIILKATPSDITVTYNDVVCGKGKTTSSLVGNQRLNVWVNLHKDSFAKALYDEERQNIACNIVNAINTSVPQGRFLSLDIHSGLWYDVGYGRAVGIVMETLMTESGLMDVQRGLLAQPNSQMRRASIPECIPRTFVSKAA